ncbi:MAG: MATE family efflux transporter [Planctomycetota bacterium]|nr:MATE family efflux transporter [Planctomycetota bacterium]
MDVALSESGPLPADDRSALREMLTIATPAVIGMVSFSLMQFVDRLLCANLVGPQALMAAGNGGIASWVPGSVMMGMLGVINTYVSQNLGAGKPERGAAYAWAGIWIGLAVWLLVLIPYTAAFPLVFEAMRASLGLEPVSAHIHAMETDYGRILLLGMIFTLTARTLGHYFYGMHRPMIVMASTIVGNIVNIGVSLALIIAAKRTSPELTEDVQRLALRGAAVGTVCGLIVECALPAVVFLSGRYARQYGTRRAWRPALGPVRDILRLGWPGGVMFGNEMVCWWIFMGGFVASFDHGQEIAVHGPAGWITHQYLMLSFMPAVGISIATTAIVGRCIGAGRHDLAERRTWLAVRLTMVYMGACAVCFVVLGEPMVRVFLSDEATPEQAARIVELAKVMLMMAATFQLFDGLAITISGALRGAGDTVWPGVATIFLSWGLIVGGGWLTVNLLPGLSSYGPWAAASLYIITLSLVLLARFRVGRWKSMKVLEGGREGVSEARGGAAVLGGDPGGVPEVAMAPALDVPGAPGRGFETSADRSGPPFEHQPKA